MSNKIISILQVEWNAYVLLEMVKYEFDFQTNLSLFFFKGCRLLPD